MPSVRAKENEPFDNVYKRFRRAVEKANVLSDIRKRAHFEKPSKTRKRAKLAAVKRELKRKSRENQSFERDRKRFGKSYVAPLVFLDEQNKSED